ncbi:carbon-nitrogen hydrolase family protein [Gordonia insulae]|uniref:(R)-stereoselective amidase n=1 Tax=Gordonia insulae TaxID=2420509 RepID=A0A3G8JTD6_9ACTN|nr:carbon-nitrogen hydrolase family protein [Gordonia insulae]AZG48198.1 (R)-stereoselective amidase [Gordonia insulae]
MNELSSDGGQLRVALWQCESAPGRVEDNLARLESAIAAAARQSADLLVTPEMMITGYDIGAEDARRLADPVGGPVGVRVARMARRHDVAVLYGCAESTPDGLVYNAIRLVGRDGTSLATHHKTHLFGELDRRMVAAGQTAPPVIDCAGWRLGLLTCYEVEFPELVRGLALRGADLVCVPTANMIEYDVVQDVLVPARALESQVYVAYANYCGAEGDLVYGGRSEMAAPTGLVVAAAGRGPELIVVDIDRRTLDETRERYPYLNDRRPEIY